MGVVGVARSGGITHQVSSFVSHLGLEDLNAVVRASAKKAILDCLGVACAARNLEVSHLLVNAFGGASGAASIVGHDKRADPATAALVNGALCHALDFDDSSEGLYGHPSAALVPALMALGEQKLTHGAEFLAAYVAGFEVASKIGRVMPRRHYDAGWHNSSTIGSIAAAAATSRLLKLDVDGVTSAVGLAASFASGLRQNFGTLAKPIHLGAAARNGVTAGLLARHGVTADAEILEGKYGFFKLFSMGADYDLSGLAPSLGQPFELQDPGVRIKVYPTCTATHRPVEAAIELAQTHDIDPARIADVECQVVYEVPEVLIRPMARTADEARFSLNYCVARALISRRLALADFDNDQILQPSVQQLMRRVRTVVPHYGRPGAYAREFAVVSVTLDSGETLTKTVYEQRGHPSASPLSWEEVSNKFAQCAEDVLGSRTAHLIDLVDRLEELPDVGILCRALAIGGVQ